MISYMKKAAGALIAASAVICTTNAIAADPVHWRASGSFPPNHSTSIAMEVFKSEVARLSKNTIQVDLFPNNTLGGALEQVDQLRTGQIQMAWGSLGFYDKLAPELSGRLHRSRRPARSTAISADSWPTK
jgi:TRAP-type C4-dicarboxylate transport system substrate-binding protein